MSTRNDALQSHTWRGITIDEGKRAALRRAIQRLQENWIGSLARLPNLRLSLNLAATDIAFLSSEINLVTNNHREDLERIVDHASILVVVIWKSYKNSKLGAPFWIIEGLRDCEFICVYSRVSSTLAAAGGNIMRQLEGYESKLDSVASNLESNPGNIEINKVLLEALNSLGNLEVSVSTGPTRGDKKLKVDPIAVKSDEDGTERQQCPITINAGSSESEMLIESAISDDESSDEDRVDEHSKRSMKYEYTETKTPKYLEIENLKSSIHPDWEETTVNTLQEVVDLHQPLSTTNMAALNADIECFQPQENIEMKSFWIVAKHALKHVQENQSQIEAIFATHGIRKSDYVLYAGFDESLIHAEVGYLEQIHIFTLANITASSESSDLDLLSQLGRIFSPFSSILFTKSCIYELPVYKADGTIWVFEDLVFQTASRLVDQGSTAALTTVICMSKTSGDNNPSASESPRQSGSSNQEKKWSDKKGKGKEDDKNRDRDEENNDDDRGKDSDDPDDDKNPEQGSAKMPRFLFDVDSEIVIAQNGVEERFQALAVQGKIMTQEEYNPFESYSECNVKFLKLNFSTEPGLGALNKRYEQTRLRVTIDPGDRDVDANVIQPRQTLASDGEIKGVSGCQRSLARTGSMGFSLTGLTPKGTVTIGSSRTIQTSVTTERKHYANQITQKTRRGIVRWEFQIDDEANQQGGIKMEDKSDSRLPHAYFEFDSEPKSAPRFIDVEVASYWSLMSSERHGRKSLFNTMFSNARTDNTIYSNMCQAVGLKIPSNLTKRSSYRATLKVNISDPELRPITKDIRVNGEEVGTIHSIDRATYDANEHGRWENETLLDLLSLRQP